MGLYQQIGRERLESILSQFYQRCFADLMIGHFFFEKNHEELLAQQLSFTSGLLGGPGAYSGRPLTPLHAPLQIRPPQFARRQMILRETMEEFALDKPLADAWLAAEERLKALIMPDLFANCRD